MQTGKKSRSLQPPQPLVSLSFPFHDGGTITLRFIRALTRGSLSERPGGRPTQCVTPLTSTTHCRSPTDWCKTSGGGEGGGADGGGDGGGGDGGGDAGGGNGGSGGGDGTSIACYYYYPMHQTPTASRIPMLASRSNASQYAAGR